MAKIAPTQKTHQRVHKRTNQGGSTPKTGSMNKHQKRSYKAYRGQGK
jgi:hypothetical protein